MRRAWGLVAMLVAGRTAATPPPFAVDASLQPAATVESEARSAWSALEQRVLAAAQWTPPTPRTNVILRRDPRLPPSQSGASELGVTRLRQNRDGNVDESLRVTLRHELAHQFLWLSCPASSSDQLFHEAFALATSGELASWTDGKYLSITAATKQLAEARTLDDLVARRALARVLVETSNDSTAFPPALIDRLRRCASGAAWEPLTVDALSASAGANVGDAFVMLNRHSGEILVTEGDWKQPMPFGSTLKPFLLAGVRARNGAEPTLSPRQDAEWSCGQQTAEPMDGETALLRSCNGYFIDWAKRDASVAQFGAFGPVLSALGLSRLPADVSEAIGIRPTLSLSPVAMAQAYRLLAGSRPDVIALLRQNAKRGTLSELPVSSRLASFALKTGTVRDAVSRPTVGWIVAVSDDVVTVMVRRQQMPRQFAGEFVERLKASKAQSAAEVQVFGLLPREKVEVKCPRLGVIARRSGPERTPAEFHPLLPLVKRGEMICLGAPWMVRVPNAPNGREYAGSFRFDAAPLAESVAGESVSAKAQAARRGSDFIFRTSLARYATGVVNAEDSRLTGGAREALLRIVAHNASEDRHPGRPICDTTHCQTFLGTGTPQRGDDRIVAKGVPQASGWLLFSQGGTEPWERTVRAGEVEKILGRHVTALRFKHGRALFVRQSAEGELFDERANLPCESLRGPLKLPSCPDRAEKKADRYVFVGHGAGHGEGLDVEWARRNEQLNADELLKRAYRKNEKRSSKVAHPRL